MRRFVTALPAVLAAFGFAGCIVADTRHTLYLAPGGGVSWSVLEQDVRSLEGDRNARDVEEGHFLGTIARDQHPVAEGLRYLGPERASVRLLRAERPFVVLTEARFGRLDRVVEQFFMDLGVPVQATMHASAIGGTLSVSVDLSVLDGDGAAQETPVDALLEDLDRYRLVLTEGRFTAADGFEVSEDGCEAKLKVVDRRQLGPEGVATLALGWKTGRR
jgi:hypothetical protein